jgi:hypothetical protein
MKRSEDLKWFLDNRGELTRDYAALWLVVHDGRLVKVSSTEEEALAFAVSQFGINEASVFHASEKDPFVYVG